MKYLIGTLLCSTLLLAQTETLIIDSQDFQADDKKGISIRELDEKAKEQGISGRTMRDVRSRMKNELEYQVNEKQENSIRLKE